ncbi:RUN and FYVE domain-containing protein 2 isoform X2 [Parasteatoda tepidariorum]|uniref:RUN and FYVE domain-containing protein 2 isoform X2 n=1 Tax=Parasteatoda tepidariorum TaxID=114398 RepID=UPI001C71B75C|nr:RUN and FYVE domain-containing protein 2 isoform X2 [Parasteatoda tepidariorum]
MNINSIYPLVVYSRYNRHIELYFNMAKDTIYLCNFRVSVDGEWLCLRELTDVQFEAANQIPPLPKPYEMKEERDPVAIERSNLLNVIKLVVKELIESSLKYGRQLDSDHVPLQHFFILMEHAMRHGLKPKKGLLGPKKELWNVLESVEKYMPEASDITASVRELPSVKTHLGRARAWLRLALMQKKLSDYFRRLIDGKDDILREFYEKDALMMSEEAIIVGGLLVGLNVIDCNLCVKEEDLDYQQGVIDFSLYLRESNGEVQPLEGVDTSNFTAVLDQKNYIEELNRHLNATVTDLQQKVEQLQTTNALMKEDLAISKNQIITLQDENAQLRKLCDRLSNENKKRLDEVRADMNAERETYQTTQLGLDSMYTDIRNQLQSEISKKKELEVECELQRTLRDEAEVAMKLLEKDIHEKQDTILSMRRQLEDIKAINLQLYTKLQESEKELKAKTTFTNELESKIVELNRTLHELEDKSYDLVNLKSKNEEMVRKFGAQLAEKDQMRSVLESDLKIERAHRASLQSTIDNYQRQITSLKDNVKKLQLMSQEYEKLRISHSELQKLHNEHERTLEEMGIQLKDSKLKIEDMKESQMAMKEAVWTHDKQATICRQCNKPFSVARRKHHCRHCGDIFCNSCSDNTMPLPSSAKPVRVCDTCYSILLHRYSATTEYT